MIRRLAPIAIALGAAAIFTARSVYDPDLFWHLAQGREVLAGHLLRTNFFSATAPQYPQHYTSWGFEAALAAVTAAGGLVAVQFAQFALLALALLALYQSARVRHSGSAAVTVLLLSLFVLEPRAMPRPYLVSLIGIAICAYTIERCQRDRPAAVTAIGPIVPLIGIWANFHSEAVFGAALIGLFGVCEYARPTAVTRPVARGIVGIALVCVMATLMTPYGSGMWRYLVENAFVPQALRIAELQPPSPETYPAFFAYLAVLVAAMASQPRRLQLWEVAIALVFAAMGLRYIRFTPLVVFATAPILAARIDALIARGWDRRAVWITAAAVMALTAPASPMRTMRAWRTGADAVAPPEIFSADAVAFARAHALSGPLFNSMNLGGYLSWTLPESRVFQDSRLQSYPPGHFTAILDASQLPEQWRVLVKDVDWAMVSLARPNELSGVGQFPPGEWASVFRDRAVEIFVRRSGRYAGLIPRT